MRPIQAKVGGVLALAGSLALAGCVSYSGGHSGTCRYGLRTGQGGNHCYSRPKPSGKQIAQAMSADTLARALTAWKRTPRNSVLTSVGINWWAETTFTTPTGATGFGEARNRLVTFDAQGRLTRGNDGYVSEPHEAFPIGAVRPDVPARVLSTIRGSQPDARLLRAALNVNAFSNALLWRVAVISTRASSDIIYVVAADGSGLCHGPDYVTKDPFVPAREIPTCARSPLPF